MRYARPTLPPLFTLSQKVALRILADPNLLERKDLRAKKTVRLTGYVLYGDFYHRSSRDRIFEVPNIINNLKDIAGFGKSGLIFAHKLDGWKEEKVRINVSSKAHLYCDII